MNQYDSQMSKRDRENRLLDVWRPLLEAKGATDVKTLKDRTSAVTAAVLLENQYKHMQVNPDTYGVMKPIEKVIQESIGTQGVFHGYSDGDAAFSANHQQPVSGEYGNAVDPTNNDFYARGDTRLPNVIMPMIRRTFPELLATEIVGVQPMNGPVGMAFALRYTYDSESLSQITPDGGTTNNGTPPCYRSNGQEAGHNYLNTAHTGTTSGALGGLGVQGTGTSGSDFDFTQEDQGVARLLADVECSTDIPQMSFQLEKIAVEAGSRKIAVKYSLELEQDLSSMHNLSVDDEMTGAMGYELQAEIDRELLMRIIQTTLNAGPDKGFTYWSPASADGRWSAERAVNLWQAIRVQARLVGLRNRRGAANFMVVTPYVSAILETLPNFKAFEIKGDVEQVYGNSRAGTLGSMKVFVDTRSEAQYQASIRDVRVDYILLGFKGAMPTDSGLLFLPYIPLIVQRSQGFSDFSPRIGMSTRYAIAANLFGSENYYHMIIMKGLTDGFTTDTPKKFLW